MKVTHHKSLLSAIIEGALFYSGAPNTDILMVVRLGAIEFFFCL